LIAEQGQAGGFCHGPGGSAGIQPFDRQGQGQVAGSSGRRGLAGSGAGLAQAGQGEVGWGTQAHQDQGLGGGVQAIQAEAFPRLGLEAPLVEAVGQGLAQGRGQQLQLGVLRPIVGTGEQADGQAVAVPLAQGRGQVVGDAAKLHGPAGVGRDRSQRG